MTSTPTQWLAPARVNTNDAPDPGAHSTATNAQQNATVISLTNGNYLVAWEDYSGAHAFGLEPPDIAGQIYSPLGQKIGGELDLSVIYDDLTQQMPDIAALPGGGFAVAYQTTDAAGFGDLENIIVETFDSTGSFVGWEDFRNGFGVAVNDVAPAIASFADGAYVVAFANDSAGNYNIDAYVVSAAGTRGPAIAIESAAANASLPDAAVLANGNFVVAYQQANASNDIGFSVRTAAGVVVANGLAAATAGSETAPAVAALTGGGFVIVWRDTAGDGAGNPGIKFRIFDNLGVGGTTFSANAPAAGSQDSATVTALADGGFVIGWRDGPTASIRAARFAADGTDVGSEFVFADRKADSDPHFAVLQDGRFAGVFTDVNAGNSNILQAIFDPRTSPISGTNAGETLTSRLDGARVNGLGGVDRLYGFDGADTLDGGTGADVMRGGKGNDVYYVDNAADQTIEKPGAGIDDVHSTVNRALGADLENLVLDGAGNLNGNGNALANLMSGNTGNNKLQGFDGNDTIEGGDGADTLDGGNNNDTLDGGTGNDSMTGGAGDDRFVVDSAGDIVREAANGGTDTVASTINYTLRSEFENLELLGNAGLSGTGNAAGNQITGNAGGNLLKGIDGADTLDGAQGNDSLNGGSGKDVLIGGSGDDVMAGGSEADTFRFAVANTGADTISDFDTTLDRFDLAGGTFSSATRSGGNTTLVHAGGTILVKGVTLASVADWNALVLPAGGQARIAGAHAQDEHVSIEPAWHPSFHADFAWA